MTPAPTYAVPAAYQLTTAEDANKFGLVQEGVDFECGVHRTHQSGGEQGVHNPTATMVMKIERPLNVEPLLLLKPVREQKVR